MNKANLAGLTNKGSAKAIELISSFMQAEMQSYIHPHINSMAAAITSHNLLEKALISMKLSNANCDV
jgi:hypothetical protein